MKKNILICIALIFFASCSKITSLQKRHYTKGYYIANTKSKSSSKSNILIVKSEIMEPTKVEGALINFEKAELNFQLEKEIIYLNNEKNAIRTKTQFDDKLKVNKKKLSKSNQQINYSYNHTKNNNPPNGMGLSAKGVLIGFGAFILILIIFGLIFAIFGASIAPIIFLVMFIFLMVGLSINTLIKKRN